MHNTETIWNLCFFGPKPLQFWKMESNIPSLSYGTTSRQQIAVPYSIFLSHWCHLQDLKWPRLHSLYKKLNSIFVMFYIFSFIACNPITIFSATPFYSGLLSICFPNLFNDLFIVAIITGCMLGMWPCNIEIYKVLMLSLYNFVLETHITCNITYLKYFS